MRKAQIFLSNHLDQLLSILKKELFLPGSNPFEKRFVVVPHLGMKNYLMQAFAKDPDLLVATGFKMGNLAQIWSKITKKSFPSLIELSLFLEHQLISMMDEEKELQAYFGTQGKERRVGSFCDIMARFFLSYAVFGKQELKGWQQRLWEAVSQRWTFPAEGIKGKGQQQIHLFGFDFIPKAYFNFFEHLKARFYLFSPCQIFWGDFYSKKEKNFLQKQIHQRQLNFFETFCEQQNPLLANWGKVGRKMFSFVEETNRALEEHYVEVKEKRNLHILQNAILQGEPIKIKGDESLSFFSVSSRLQEMHRLKAFLFDLFNNQQIQPSDVQVFAPDMSVYVPFIQATFTEIEYSISDIEAKLVDPLIQAFSKLIELPKKRFSLDALMQLFETPLFRDKFDLNVGLFRRWLERANVNWGYSKQQRRTFYLKDVEEDHLMINVDSGTWEAGFKRLILGLGFLEGEGYPLPIVELSEIEQFDRLFFLVRSLAEDLEPLLNGTKWTIPQWLRYCVCLIESYFVCEEEQNLYQQLLQLASFSHLLDEGKIPFSGIEHVLIHLFAKKNRTHQTAHLQAIRFASILEGCVFPGKVICLIGMQEDSFPRHEENHSLYAGTKDFKPKKNEEDRYQFLQLLLSAREFFFTSYVRDPEGKLGSSILVDELLSELEEGQVVHDQEGDIPQELFLKKPPLLPEFFSSITIEKPVIREPLLLDIQKLFKFAKHPLRYFFHETLKIFPEYKQKKEEKEFVLSPLTKYQLVREAFKKPIEMVIKEAKEKGDLPLNLLMPLAIEQIEREIISYDVFPQEKQIEPISLNGVTLFGKLDNFSSEGLLVQGKDCLEDRIRFWPQGLLAKKLGIPLIFLKDKKEGDFDGSLEKYVEYFLVSSKHPSPLLPSFAKALLFGTGEDLKIPSKKAEDEIWDFLFFRDPFPDAVKIHKNWNNYLKGCFLIKF